MQLVQDTPKMLLNTGNHMYQNKGFWEDEPQPPVSDCAHKNNNKKNHQPWSYLLTFGLISASMTRPAAKLMEALSIICQEAPPHRLGEPCLNFREI